VLLAVKSAAFAAAGAILIWHAVILHRPHRKLSSLASLPSRAAVLFRPPVDGPIGNIRIPPEQRKKIDAVVEFINSKLRPGELFFDLSNQGAWYFFAGRPSPVRYHHAVYAGPPRMQQEIIDGLERSRVRLVISSSGTPFDCMDGVCLKERQPLLWRYFRNKFVHGGAVDTVQFLERAPTDLLP
jgi:hypothetical protein